MRNKFASNHVLFRDGVYYYVRRVPYDLVEHYTVKRLCFSLKTKSSATACRAAQSISQRLEDYWLGLRLQNMDIPAIEVVKSNIGPDDDSSPLLSEALALYLRLKGVGKGDVFARTATRNNGYVIEHLGDRPICSYSSADAFLASFPSSSSCCPFSFASPIFSFCDRETTNASTRTSENAIPREVIFNNNIANIIIK